MNEALKDIDLHFLLFVDHTPLPSYYLATELLKKIYPIQPKMYDICGNGCVLFTGNNVTSCPICNKGRFKDGGGLRQPYRQMVVLPIEQQIGCLLYHRKTRDLILHDYDPACELLSHYTDVFDGNIFNNYHHQKDVNNIYIGLYFDGFSSTSKKSQGLGLIHAIIFNIHPLNRYKSQNMMQYTIFPGPKMPTKNNMKLYLAPLFQELASLEKNGLKVNCDDESILHVKVHCVYITGDQPAISSVSGLKGHTSDFPCRICKIKTTLQATTTTTATTTSANKKKPNRKYLNIGETTEMRTANDFRNGDINGSIQKNKHHVATQLVIKPLFFFFL
jgi:hypothetical protein